MERIRVCHVISGDLWGGAEAVAAQLLFGLQRYPDIEPAAVVLNRGRLAAELSRFGLPVTVFDEGGTSLPGLLRGIRRRVLEFRPHVIHSHRYKENLLSCLAAATAGRVQLIATQHGMPEPVRGRRSRKHRLLMALNHGVLSKFFARTVAVSHDIKNLYLSSRSLPAERLTVIHNGIELPDATGNGVALGQLVVGSAGRLCPVKDHPLMVEIAREVSARSGKIRWELAGDGPDLARLRSMIRQYHLEDSFTLLGHLDRMSDFYPGLDLYLSTSVHEGIPMSVLEAMAHGIPVVAPRVGGFPEIIDDGENGYLIEGRSPGDYVEKLCFLSENASVRVQMGLAARAKVVREFSVDQMIQRYRDLYHAVVRSPGRALSIS